MEGVHHRHRVGQFFSGGGLETGKAVHGNDFHSVNRLAIAALIAACAAGKNLVDEASARSAVTETNNDPQPATP